MLSVLRWVPSASVVPAAVHRPRLAGDTPVSVACRLRRVSVVDGDLRGSEVTESPYPGPHIQVNLDTWAQRIESKLDRYHEDMQRQILELQKAPPPVKDGEVRVSSLEARVAQLERDSDENTRFRLDSVVSRRMVARGWGVAATVGALAATVFQVISSALR